MRRRNSLRYPGYDYGANAAYFVTLCVQSGLHLFGQVANGQVHLTDAGQMIEKTLLELPAVIPEVLVDTAVVMPNHLHALIILNSDDKRQPAVDLGGVMRRFKTLTTNRYVAGVHERGWPRFEGKLWQRNFHDHIIRSDRGFDQVRRYIEGNPCRWQERQDAIRVPEHS